VVGENVLPQPGRENLLRTTPMRPCTPRRHGPPNNACPAASARARLA
jgi:hypothetical protein